MKSIALLLLLSGLVVAAPLDPPGSPGRERSSDQVARMLDQAELVCRRRGDQPGLVEVECLRLEPLLARFDPSCPERMRALEAGSLPPGPARARLFWVRGVYAGLSGQAERALELKKLALLEPGVPGLWKAEWLSKLAYQKDTSAFLNWLDGQLLLILESEPEPAVAWFVLEAQAKVAQGRGQKALKESLTRAQADLAEKQRWPLEQLQANLALYEIHGRERVYWDRALAVARRQKRDDWTRQLFASAPTERDWQAAANLLLDRGSRAQQARDWLAWRRREQHDQLEVRVKCQRDLIDDARQRGDCEGELRSRVALYFALRDTGRIRESLRELEAAVQFRLDHPPSNPTWVHRDVSLGGLGRLWVDELANTGHYHQSQACCERALDERWAVFPEDQLGLIRSSVSLAEKKGETARADDSVRLLQQLMPRQPGQEWLAALEWLGEKGPEQDRAGYLAQAEALVLKKYRTTPQGARSGSLYNLGRLTRQQAGKGQTLQFWLNQLEQAREDGDAEALEISATQLLYAYREAGRLEDFKELSLSLLQAPETPRALRLTCLNGCDFLALHHDSLSLEWAEALMRQASQPFERRDAHYHKATVLGHLGRLEEALSSLDQAQALENSNDFRAEVRRALLLWEAKRHQQALRVLDGLIERLIHSESPRLADFYIRERARYARELRLEWQEQLEKRIVEYQALGEIGEPSRDYLLGEWLKFLAEDQQWQQGREVVARHPWRKPANDGTTKKLRAFPEWQDLFPAEKARATPPQDAQTLPRLVDELRLQQPELGQLLTLRSTNLKHLQKQLQPQDTLVTYCQQGGNLYLLALRQKDSFFRRYPVNQAELEATSKRYLDSLRSQPAGDAESTLYQLLLQPVLSDDPQQRVFLVPNGILWQLPFGALRDESGRAAASRAELVMLGSGDLLRLADGDWTPYRLSHPLAIGAPPAADLPGAFQELADVARLLPGCQLRRGEQATLGSLYERDQQWGLLHFAAHAHYRPDHPVESDIELHDGKLQVKQLSQLSLSDHALVALSVCQGGASQGQQLDEPVTLATGFSAAGAETVVANLWPVDDEVAHLFFTAFYRQLAAGNSPSSSFREAQQLCRQSFPKTCDWGGFFLLGNPG